MRPDQHDVEGPLGFRAAGLAAGLKPSGALDLGLLLCDVPAVAAGVFTTNRLCSPTITVCRQRLSATSSSRGVIVNAGNANAATGERGLKDAIAMASTAEKLANAQAGEFFVNSTGRIGECLPIDRITDAIPRLFERASRHGWKDFAAAIMTTDTFPKLSGRFVELDGGASRATVLGVAKGSGMISPKMATMLAYVVTDYPLSPAVAQPMLMRVNAKSFNSITVDADQSTNDALLLLSSGLAVKQPASALENDDLFEEALSHVCCDLARAICRDGEGGTKLVSVNVLGARSDDDARSIATAVANSNLVKTALFGNDPNWGRIYMAIGNAGVEVASNRFSISIQGHPVLTAGQPVPHDRQLLRESMKRDEVEIGIALEGGDGKATVWTCDLSYDYVRINAEYTT